MGYLDDNGLARLWEKIKNHICNAKNVIAPAPNVPIDILDNDNVYLNHVAGGEIASSHRISGTGGTRVVSHSSGTNNFDGVIEISSAGVNMGIYTPSETVGNSAGNSYEIDTGFTETPKLFKLYYNSESEGILTVVECRPQLDSPYRFISHNNLPVSGVSFDGGIVTVKWHVSIAVSVMWEAYI